MVSLSTTSRLPTSQQVQGNKRRIPYKIQIERSGSGFYSAGCEERIESWSGWDGGLNGRILIKNAGDPAIPTWTVVIQLDKNVDKLQSYDGNTEKLDDRTYKISPLKWNAEANEAAKRIVNVQVTWKQGEVEPKIR